MALQFRVPLELPKIAGANLLLFLPALLLIFTFSI